MQWSRSKITRRTSSDAQECIDLTLPKGGRDAIEGCAERRSDRGQGCDDHDGDEGGD